MEECLDHGDTVTYPTFGTDEPTFPIHRQWSLSTGGSQVRSIVLNDGGQPVAVISVRRPASYPLATEQVESLSSKLAPSGSMLRLIDLANQSLWDHAASWLLQRARVRWHPLRWAIVAAAAALIFWTMFGTMVYRPLCQSSVVSAQLRHMTAPFEARLVKVSAEAGDTVRAGDVLLEFETFPLLLERETIRAEIAASEIDVRRAIEEGEISAAALHKAHIAVLVARERSITRKIDSAKLTAPSDGMLIESHFDKRLGQIFTHGQPLLQFAPDQGWEIEVQVPEHIAALVKPGQEGAFISAGAPDERVPFQIRQVEGSATVVDQENVFVARATLLEDPKWVRSGMHGVARITTSKKPVSWVAFHRLVDWLRLRFWI
jgi:multidrug resistance efflux pump